MRRSKHFFNLPVFSLNEGQQIGKVRGLVIDPDRKTLTALIIEEKGWFKEQKFIPFSKVHSVGENAVTIEHSNAIQKGASLPDIVKYSKDKISIIGTRLVMENGTILGQVDEFYIGLPDGKITGLELSSGILKNVIDGKAFLSSEFIRTFGKQVTICSNDTLENIKKTKSNLQETMSTVKDKASSTWSFTLNKSRKITTAINRPFKREKNNFAEETPLEDINIADIKIAENPENASVTVIIPEENSSEIQSPRI